MRDDSIGHVSKGERPSASHENRQTDAINVDHIGRGMTETPSGTVFRPLPFVDISEIFHKPNAEVPAYGVMVDNGLTATVTCDVLSTRATQTLGERPLYVNYYRVAGTTDGGICRAAWLRPIDVAYDDTDGTPALGETWGPVPSSFKIRKGYPGFKVLRTGADGVVRCMYEPSPEYYGTLTQDMSDSGAAWTPKYWDGDSWEDGDISDTVYARPSGDWYDTDDVVMARWKSASRRLEVQDTGALQTRSFVLRSTFTIGHTAIAEVTHFDDLGTTGGKILCPTGTLFRVFDRFKEFYNNTDNRACGWAWRRPDTPATYEEIESQYPIESGEEETAVDDERPWEILRITCPDFEDCPCAGAETPEGCTPPAT